MRNNGYLEYHKSIAREFMASQDRVRYFIDDNHWPEDGRYKEILLMNYLKKILPANVSIGTGFVKSSTDLTKQIDIIIYDNTVPTLFAEGDFVIVIPESVYGIIEVKTNLNNRNFKGTVENANENGRTIGDINIFNGIFAYSNSYPISKQSRSNTLNSVQGALVKNHGYVNHISFGSDIFVKYWEDGNPKDQGNLKTFSFYEIEELSFGYFISNLIYYIYKKSDFKDLTDSLNDYLFPISEGKESKRLSNWEVKI